MQTRSAAGGAVKGIGLDQQSGAALLKCLVEAAGDPDKAADAFLVYLDAHPQQRKTLLKFVIRGACEGAAETMKKAAATPWQ